MKAGYTVGATVEELAAFLNAIAGWEYMILHNAADIHFTRYDAKTEWSIWDKGVVFGNSAQLTWRRRRGGAFHLVLLTSGDLPAGFTDAGKAAPVGDISAVFLWGERIFTSEGAPMAQWAEGRIPKIISGEQGYPLDTNPAQSPCRAVLQVEILELPNPGPETAGIFNPAPPRRLERYLGLEEVCGEEA